MLRNIPLILLVSASLVACGGSDNKKKNNSSSSVPSSVASSAPASVASSAPASVASSAPASVASSAPASSTPASSSVASSSAASNIINVDLASMRANNGSTLTLGTDGATLVASVENHGAVFDVLKPTMLEGSVVEFVVRVDNAFKTIGTGLQIFAQLKEDWSNGEWDCATESSALIADQDVTLSCTIDEGDDKLNQSLRDVQVGIQAKGASFAGSVLIKSAKITLATQGASSSMTSSSAPSQASGTYIPTSLNGWFVNGGGSPNQMQLELNAATGSGLNMVPVDWAENAANNYKYEARFTLPAPQNIEAGDVITYTVVVPQSYIDDATAVLQINWHNVAGGGSIYGGAGGGYRTLSAAGGVSSGVDFVISETVTSAGALANTDTLGLQISVAPSNTNIKDKILIKSVSVQ